MPAPPIQSFHPSQRNPNDAATLIILRRDMGKTPRILLGKRHETHRFMPGKFVFPGGRVDSADCRFQPQSDLHAKVSAKLLIKMRGRISENRARGLAMAAVRETFEETGFIIGTKLTTLRKTKSTAWQEFIATGYGPDLSGLRLFARAITPPGRSRRFDTRFFVVEADHVANLSTPATVASDELLEPHWFTIEEARQLDLPWITGQILDRLEKRLMEDAGLNPGGPYIFQYSRAQKWQYEHL